MAKFVELWTPTVAPVLSTSSSGTVVNIELDARALAPDRECYLRFDMNAAVAKNAGATAAALAPAYDLLQNNNAIQLLNKNNQELYSWSSHQLWYESNFFVDESRLLYIQSLQNQGKITTPATTDQPVLNNVANARYYVYLPGLYNTLGRLPTSALGPKPLILRLNMRPVGEIIVTDNTGAVVTDPSITQVNLLQVGTSLDGKAISAFRDRFSKGGQKFRYQKCITDDTNTSASGATSVTLRYSALRSQRVSSLILFAVDDAVYNKAYTAVAKINQRYMLPIDFANPAPGSEVKGANGTTIKIGTPSNDTKYSLRTRFLSELKLWDRDSMIQGAVPNLILDGITAPDFATTFEWRSYPIYVYNFCNSQVSTIEHGSSDGSAKFPEDLQIKIENMVTSGKTQRYIAMFYVPTEAHLKQSAFSSKTIV